MARILPITPMLMRGLGPGPSLITTGFGPIIGELIRIVRGGRSVLRDIYGHKVEEFKIATKLLEINGKQLLKPIFTNNTYTVDERIQTNVRIDNISIASKQSDNKVKVQANLLKVKRGLDG